MSSSVAVSVFTYSHMYFSSSSAGAPPTHVTTAASAPSHGTRLTATVRPLDTKGRCVTSVSSSKEKNELTFQYKAELDAL